MESRAIPNEDGWITARVHMGLSEIIDLDLESFLDEISERAGYPLLMQQEYRVVALEDDGATLVLEVKGDASADLDDYLDEEG